MTNLERKIEEDSIRLTIQEIDSKIMDLMIQLEMLKASKLMAENHIQFRQTLN